MTSTAARFTPNQLIALLESYRTGDPIRSGLGDIYNEVRGLIRRGYIRAKDDDFRDVSTTDRGRELVEELCGKREIVNNAPQAGFVTSAHMSHPINYSRAPMFARFVRAEYNNGEFVPGQSISVNAADVMAFYPATKGSEGLSHVTYLTMRNGYEYLVLCGYDSVAQRLAEAYSNPYE